MTPEKRSMRCVFLALALLIAPATALAQDFKMEPPKSPAESLACIKVRPGFKVELMVAEPLVMDPIAFAWGPDGKFWVVEMGDYPLGVDGKNKPGGKIKYLEKTKPDGPYDKMTVFMDNVGYPTGVFPYGKGVLVTCAPDIFYAEDTKGTGKADKKEVLFTGFKEGNQQHRVNGLTWGIDNWIYGANGDSGGVIKSIKTGKTVDIRGRDFRLKPDTGEFEAVSGQSQFGRCRDDWGNWFGNNNSNPMFHYVLDDQYLKRNPHVLYPDPKVNVSIKPGASQVFPISKPLARFNTPQALNHFTSACSTIIYRDTLFGKEFEGNAFISEPVHNLIHREIMKPKGVTFTSQRADDEQTSEFLASSDNWFRPAMIQVGPDGALWIADMYRYVIEHPEWIPKDWQKKLDLRAGHDLGRIYRVYPEERPKDSTGRFRRPTPNEVPRMDHMNTKELVASLRNPNGWVRDTAQQLLIQRGPIENKKEIVSCCDEFVRSRKAVPPAPARLHALYVLRHFNALGRFDDLCDDPDPIMRKHAIALCGEFAITTIQDQAKLKALLADLDDGVRLQLAYSAGHIPKMPMAALLFENAHDRYLLAATLSSVTKENWTQIFDDLSRHKGIPAPLYPPLMAMAGVYDRHTDVAKLVIRQLNAAQIVTRAERFHHVGDLLDAMDRNTINLTKFLERTSDKEVASTLNDLRAIHGEAVTAFVNTKSPANQRKLALRLLGRGLGDDVKDFKMLAAVLTPQSTDEEQAAVVSHLANINHSRAAEALLISWKSYTPGLRDQVLDGLLTKPLATRMALDAVEKKQILPQEVSAIRRQRLLKHTDASIRRRAEQLLGSASNSDRAKIVYDYLAQMPAKGDAAKGAKLFAKACATCHKLGDVGQNVGPDFAAIGDKSPQGLLTAILDPNRAVEARYINYVASTKKGLILTGILTSETSTSITLTANDGKQHQLLRNEIDDLSSTGQSMMPEGLEKDLSPQDLADLIEHIRSALPKEKGKTGKAQGAAHEVSGYGVAQSETPLTSFAALCAKADDQRSREAETRPRVCLFASEDRRPYRWASVGARQWWPASSLA